MTNYILPAVFLPHRPTRLLPGAASVRGADRRIAGGVAVVMAPTTHTWHCGCVHSYSDGVWGWQYCRWQSASPPLGGRRAQ